MICFGSCVLMSRGPTPKGSRGHKGSHGGFCPAAPAPLPPIRQSTHLWSAAAFLAEFLQLFPADRGRGLAWLGTGFHQNHPAALGDHARISGHGDRSLKVVTWEVEKGHRQLSLEPGESHDGVQGPTLALSLAAGLAKLGRRGALGCQGEACPPPKHTHTFLAQKGMPLSVSGLIFWFYYPKISLGHCNICHVTSLVVRQS